VDAKIYYDSPDSGAFDIGVGHVTEKIKTAKFCLKKVRQLQKHRDS